MIKIIAENATYWHGDHDLLRTALMQSIAVGADFFKVQVYDTKYIGNQWKHRKEFYENNQLDVGTITDLRILAEKNGAELIATINQPHLVAGVREAGITSVKIASGQILPLLVNEISKYSWDRVFVSTGMIPENCLYHLDLITKFTVKSREVVVMHCVSLYPTTDSETNLKRISSLTKFFKDTGVSIGYSDHHLDELPILGAMFMGATYIEKHIKTPESFGSTCEIAADMNELLRTCNLRKRVEMLLGDGKITMQERERESYEKYKTRWLTATV